MADAARKRNGQIFIVICIALFVLSLTMAVYSAVRGRPPAHTVGIPGVPWGAPVADVYKRFPQAKASTCLAGAPAGEALSFCGGPVLSNYSVAGVPFDVAFALQGGKLVGVRLEAAQTSSELGAAALARSRFDRIASILDVRYGQRYAAADLAHGQEALWIGDETTVSGQFAIDPTETSDRITARYRLTYIPNKKSPVDASSFADVERL